MGQALMEIARELTPSAILLVNFCSFNFSAGTRAIEMSSSSSFSDMKIKVLSSIEAYFPLKMIELRIAHRGLPSFIQSPELEGLEKMLICLFCWKIDKAEASTLH